MSMWDAVFFFFFKSKSYSIFSVFQYKPLENQIFYNIDKLWSEESNIQSIYSTESYYFKCEIDEIYRYFGCWKKRKKKSSALSTVSYPTPNTLVDRRKEKTKTKIYKIHFSKIKHLKLNKEQNKNLKPINIFLEKKILNFFFSFYVLINDEMVG